VYNYWARGYSISIKQHKSEEKERNEEKIAIVWIHILSCSVQNHRSSYCATRKNEIEKCETHDATKPANDHGIAEKRGREPMRGNKRNEKIVRWERKDLKAEKNGIK
jgi:hypothetical protein